MAENVASSSRVLHSKHCVLFLRQYNQQGRYTIFTAQYSKRNCLSSLICLQPQIVAISFLKVSFSLLCTHLSLLWADENDTCTCRYLLIQILFSIHHRHSRLSLLSFVMEVAIIQDLPQTAGEPSHENTSDSTRQCE